MAQAGRRPGSPQVCGFGLLGPRPARPTRHQTLCHCLPRSPRTRRQSFASAWPVAILHLEGFKTCAKHGPSRHKTPLWAFAALPLPSQVTANTLPCSGSPLPAPGHAPFRGFQNVREARPIRTQNPSVGLYRFATAFTGQREHVALQRQPFASAWPCRHTPFRGFQNVCEARPITTQNPSVGLYCFATAFPGHRKHVALQRQSFASAWPVAILHLEGFKTCAKHGPSRHKTRLWAFTALPLPSQVTANTLPCSGSPSPAPGQSPYSIQRVSKRARSTAHHDTKPLCGPLPLCHCLPRSPRTSTAHHDTKPLCGPLPLCHCLPSSPETRCPAAAVLCQRLASLHTPFRGFQNVREARPITTQNPFVGLYRFATAFPGHREHVALQRQSFASAWPVAILHLEGFKTCAKHGPSRHKTPLWAFTALPLPSQVTANTLPCSASPLPVPGHFAILHLEGFKTCAKHGPSRHKTRLWAFTALPLPSQVTANTLPCSSSPLPAPGQSPYSI